MKDPVIMVCNVESMRSEGNKAKTSSESPVSLIEEEGTVEGPNTDVCVVVGLSTGLWPR